MSWRHADVDDCEIGPVLTDELHQFGSVARLADNVVPAPFEQARETLAHQHVIFGDDDSRAAWIDPGHRESIPHSRTPAWLERAIRT
jgi:hypothetical protein